MYLLILNNKSYFRLSVLLNRAYLQFILLCLSSYSISAQQTSDTSKRNAIKEPKHYFMSTFYFDYYSTKEVPLESGQPKDMYWNTKLKSYQFQQKSGGFFIPLYTKDYMKGDTVPPANIHLLATGSYLLATPHFSGINDHSFLKASIGLRGIYNTGGKNIWFVDYSVWAAQDITYQSKLVPRTVTTIVYDRIVSDKFSFRLGYAKTFLYGNRFRLPYLGFRVGRLDKAYLSVQFPRNITFSFPLGSKFRGAVFTKPMGGLYTMSNVDSLYYYQKDNKFQFGRYEILSGLKLEYSPSKYFSLHLNAGAARNRSISMSSFSFNKGNRGRLASFFDENINTCGFINAGITLRLGRAKKVYNNKNLYEAFDLNNSIDAGDNNSDIGNGNIPQKPQKKNLKNIAVSDVQDLIETQDLY